MALSPAVLSMSLWPSKAFALLPYTVAFAQYRHTLPLLSKHVLFCFEFLTSASPSELDVVPIADTAHSSPTTLLTLDAQVNRIAGAVHGSGNQCWDRVLAAAVAAAP